MELATSWPKLTTGVLEDRGQIGQEVARQAERDMTLWRKEWSR